MINISTNDRTDAVVPPAERVQPRINEYWSRHAVAYDEHQLAHLHYDAVRHAWIDIWQRALPPVPARVLDVGTGTGHVSLLLAGLGYPTVGTDLADGMLAQARRKAATLDTPPTLLPGDAVAPDFAPESFDAVTARYVLWTLRTPDVALRNWLTLLRPGGTLAVVDSAWYPHGVNAVDPSDPVLTSASGAPDSLSPADARRAVSPANQTVSTQRQSDFRALYNDDVLASLPLAQATSINKTAESIRAAGFADVVVTPLHEVLELDRRFGVAPGHRVQMQYLITARRG